jgi:hypothetical protein
MPVNKGNMAFTGTDGGICGYFAGGKNIIRAASSLTGKRVKEDPAFAGFLKSGNRMKQASPIAAALYKQVPKELKQFSLYRLITGEVLKRIKEGLDKAVIMETLQKEHIDPVLKNSQIKLHPNPSDAAPGLPPLYQGRVKGYRKLKTWILPGQAD